MIFVEVGKLKPNIGSDGRVKLGTTAIGDIIENNFLGYYPRPEAGR